MNRKLENKKNILPNIFYGLYAPNNQNSFITSLYLMKLHETIYLEKDVININSVNNLVDYTGLIKALKKFLNLRLL